MSRRLQARLGKRGGVVTFRHFVAPVLPIQLPLFALPRCVFLFAMTLQSNRMQTQGEGSLIKNFGAFTMPKAFNFTSTKNEGWKTDCLNWVEANQPFEIRGVGNEHLAFCNELCSACHYRYQYQFRSDDSVAIFSPVR